MSFTQSETRQEADFLKEYNTSSSEDKQKDYNIIYKIISLRSSFSNETLAAFYRPNIEWCMFFDAQEYKKHASNEIDEAMSIEKENIDKAIEIYEKYVSSEWSRTTIPYDRLAILYRKKKNYDEEIRVLKAAIFAFRNHERSFGTESFVDRLEKALTLKIKNKK
ncbi:MAG: hypothetical protein LBS36_06635 [Oscillospiraceae bacterium]|jgi:tetratricopeptide (TPR) repeat protein|nr:hypothetical protein [Oscillospiraceae bacterium]